MRVDIRNWIIRMKSKYGIEAIYLPHKDLYCLRYKGKGLQNFNTKNFYQLPQRHRENMILPLLKVGLVHNLGEKIKDRIYQQRNFGKKI